MLKNIFGSFGRALTEFIYPPFCVLCENGLEPDNHLICSHCWEILPKTQPPCVDAQETGRLQKKFYFKSSLAVWQYSQSAHEIVRFLKYTGFRHLAENLGRAMGEVTANEAEYMNADFLAPVPLHRVKYREREFNQSLLLAGTISEITRIPVNDRVIERIRYTKPQAKLNASERQVNVQGAFALREGVCIDDAVVIIVDDVITTGSTINECARIMREAKAKCVLALTAFRA